MNGYMGLFLETGDPAFYLMAKQAGGNAGVASGATAQAVSGRVSGGTGYGASDGAASPLDHSVTEEASPR